MSGTFRLAEGVRIAPLPTPFTVKPCATCIQSNTGWKEYLFARFAEQHPIPGEDGPPTINLQPEQLDAMSFPITALDVLYRLERAGTVTLGTGGAAATAPPARITLVVVGASAKAEERLLRQSTYWAEIGRHLPNAHVHLELVGLEIAPRKKASKRRGRGGGGGARQAVDGTTNMTSSVFKGTLRQWMGSECAAHVKEKRQLVVIGYNTGLGSGELSLMASWLPDLIALIKAGLPAAFTCANEAADLFGETRVMGKLLKARFVVEPYKNKWHAVTTYRCEGEQGEKEYTCANSFVYAVCGTADSSATASARLESAGYAEAALRVRSCVPFPRATLTPAIFLRALSNVSPTFGSHVPSHPPFFLPFSL